MTKIKRTLNNILLGITKNDMNKIKNVNNIPYIRILAFNDKGREIIKNIKTNHLHYLYHLYYSPDIMQWFLSN